MNNLHFTLIKVAGYRGRNFTLKMNPYGQNTVFIMDGNTGKTTIIELLRWCFHYPQSRAFNKFTHMWVDQAHVLDDTKKGSQVCEIIVQFAATDDTGQQHFFSFKRTTEGESDLNNKPTSDKITKITDTLEIDHGKKLISDDDAHAFLDREFRFNECVDYFCFDGEKAREVMQLASSSQKIADLLFLVNQRATHPRIEEYRQRLERLRERVLEDAKQKISDKALEINIGKLNAKLWDLRQAEKELENLKRNIVVHSLALKKLKDRFEELQDQITTAKANELIERTRYEAKKQSRGNEVAEKRRLIFALSQQWVSTGMIPAINQIKADVKEKGKLPEPYRYDLIKNCLGTKRCEICGRRLDKEAEERIKGLERQVAPHEVHVFLSSDFSMSPSAFDPANQYNDIRKSIEDYNRLNNKIKSIKLTDEDALLVSEKESVDGHIEEIKGNIINLQRDADERGEWIKTLRREADELQNKNAALRENKIILDKIDESINIVVATGEKIKSKTIDIISGVISEGVSSILGPRFAAKLSQEEGLMLGEDGFFGRERGGYSGRLILSYCFAEAMTLIDPIIVDTPSGNIGSQRGNLARHLVANHKQIILMCLPTEIADFAPIISPEPMEIQNLEC